MPRDQLARRRPSLASVCRGRRPASSVSIREAQHHLLASPLRRALRQAVRPEFRRISAHAICASKSTRRDASRRPVHHEGLSESHPRRSTCTDKCTLAGIATPSRPAYAPARPRLRVHRGRCRRASRRGFQCLEGRLACLAVSCEREAALTVK